MVLIDVKPLKAKMFFILEEAKKVEKEKEAHRSDHINSPIKHCPILVIVNSACNCPPFV